MRPGGTVWPVPFTPSQTRGSSGRHSLWGSSAPPQASGDSGCHSSSGADESSDSVVDGPSVGSGGSMGGVVPVDDTVRSVPTDFPETVDLSLGQRGIGQQDALLPHVFERDGRFGAVAGSGNR